MYRLTLSSQAVRRIGRAVRAQDYQVDPSTGDFVMPEGPSEVITNDPESRIQLLEDEYQQLLQQVSTLEESLSEMANETHEPVPLSTKAPVQSPSRQPVRQPAQQSGWDQFKNKFKNLVPSPGRGGGGGGSYNSPSKKVRSPSPSTYY